MNDSDDSLSKEAARATELLGGKTVARVVRNRPGEIMLEFSDGTRLFVDQAPDGLTLSIT